VDQASVAIQGALLVLGGLVLCFRGRALFRVLLPLMGFVLFGLAAVSYARVHTQGDVAYMIAAGILGGAIGAALMLAAYLYGLFLVGAAFGSHLGALIAARYGYDPGPIILLAGFAGGLAAVLAERFLIVLATAMWGAMFVVSGYLMLAGRMVPEHLLDPTALVALGHRADLVPSVWLLLALAGVIIQSLPERVVVVR